MAKAANKSVYRCQSCGHAESKQWGRCPSCGAWGSMVEEIARPTRLTSAAPGSAPAGSRSAGAFSGAGGGRPIAVTELDALESAPRRTTGIGELDRVLGGGLVPGSLVLLGGDPGIGKSTLLLQALDGLARSASATGSAPAGAVLYVSGEESVAQTGLRARRLGIASPNLLLHSETSLERILEQADAIAPVVLAIDSIQTVHTEALDGIPGSVGQVRECAARL